MCIALLPSIHRSSYQSIFPLSVCTHSSPQFLKEQNEDIRIGMVDPMGAAMFSYYSSGVLQSEGNSVSYCHSRSVAPG